MAPDLLLQGGVVYPGEGPGETANVAVRGGRIVAVARDLEPEGFEVLDAGGLAVAPGFVDMHSHCALRPFEEPELRCKITQGFTTEVINQDGVGPAPVSGDRLTNRRAYLQVFEGAGPPEWGWQSIAGYLEALDATRPATSMCPLVPHGAVRDLVMGGERRAPTAAELREMRAEVREGMLAGAWGVSFGLVYTPGAFAATDELVAMAEVAAAHDGLLIPHVRSETGRLLEAVREMIDVARRSSAALNLTHLKVMGRRNEGMLSELLETIDEAAEEGVDVTFDQYPYTAGLTTLTSTLPLWVHDGGPDRMLERLRDARLHARMVEDMWDSDAGQENHLVHCGPDAITIAGCGPDGPPDVVGRTLAGLAAERSGADPAQAAIDLLLECRLQVAIVLDYASEATVRAIARHPRMLVGSDGIFARRPHPRLWGTAPRVLGRYAIREGLFDVREAVARLSTRAAARLGLNDRGTIEPGKRADLVVFDPANLIDRATYDEPERPASGIHWVLVGGEIALTPEGPTGVRAGGVVVRR